jgi:hypothetical protein
MQIKKDDGAGLLPESPTPPFRCEEWRSETFDRCGDSRDC